jgi:flagellar basal body-associated protein FliL
MALKKILKVIAIILAISAAATAVYFLVKKLTDKKKAAQGDELESFVSCSCLDDEPILVEDKPE